MRPACERRLPALPVLPRRGRMVLAYPKVRSAPVLEIHHSRLCLTPVSSCPGRRWATVVRPSTFS
ncbi:hypothetical protein EN925_29665 [Mesorhizobium sp. M7A.F.Ca.US.006.04.2.1]|nr:hypothetical protein EN990_32860 [Mesorhizobium sp. M7A.F.Ca.US.005.03.1.1]RUY07008.1 hypothetical protein EN991_32370 [Mesorhizobium sp. M7A.F.Ca.US.005.03.2.1]RUY23378.1 hypothetical protein EN979_29200 [Mesorhizobium sp. M7A.F.Ca.US.001.04.2.1]RUY36416.1 hypothetical protein EN978_29615 [Mesorhizobium sp. M7A.F.Ca.US.001.04.1.1]RVA00807.1 hypothetical protein EN938_24370 [Mesorhizobium sp. M7A.F.Ca.US.001.02.1.1]RVA13001.1 hypothetical protein EN932_10225 [Mesorhizobium sp. M7A.F.Ca.US.0